MAGSQERVFLAQPFDAGGVKAFASPVQFLLTGEDNLRVTWITSKNVTFNVRGRMLVKESQSVQAFDYAIQQDADYSSHTRILPLAEGVLLNLVVSAELAFLTPGQLYVRVDVVRGLDGATLTLGTLLAGYVGTWSGRAWPGTPLETPLDGPGALMSYVSPDPAAGAVPLLRQQVRTRWRLISARTALTTSAVAGNRFVTLTITPRTGGAFNFDALPSVPAATGREFAWHAGIGYPGLASVSSSGALSDDHLLECQIFNDNSLTLNVAGFDAGDNFAPLTVYVEEWLLPIDLP